LNPVSRAQFIALNLVGGVCGALIVCDLVLGYLNAQVNHTVSETQSRFNQAQQLHNTAQNLVLRIADNGRTDSALRDLLAKHKFQVNLNTNNPARRSP
jgi:hypothetical protein